MVLYMDKFWTAPIIETIKPLPPKLSIPQQIENMKKKGISFSIITEADARRFLSEHNYYYKLKAYAHNFDKYKDPAKNGQYINLDFAHLKDLSTIDAHLRKIILTMCIDLEHFLKVKMLNHCCMVDEDGYEIIQELFRMKPSLEEEIKEKTNTSTCHGIVEKCDGLWAIWNIVELLSFGPFIELYILFYSRNSFQDTGVELLYSVRMLRNAAAHNNCLINQMRAPFSRSVSPTYELRNRINKLSSLSPEKVKERLQHPTIHDFLALLILYDSIVPEPTRTKGLSEIKVLFDERMPQNKDYYRKQQGLISSYSFVKEIVDKITAISD